MKAPLVREGSKENGTQVTGNLIYKGCLVWKSALLDLAPVQPLIVNTPGSASAYGIFLCRLAVPVLLCHSFNNCASSSSGYARMLTKL